MTLLQAVKKYPKACLWPMAIPLTVIMDGYDFALLGSLSAFPSVRHRFGVYVYEKSGYQIPANWQLTISSSSTVGNIFWMFFGAIATNQFGYRKSFLFWLLILTGSIQCFRLRFLPEYRHDFHWIAALIRSLRKMPAACCAYSSEASPHFTAETSGLHIYMANRFLPCQSSNSTYKMM